MLGFFTFLLSLWRTIRGNAPKPEKPLARAARAEEQRDTEARSREELERDLGARRNADLSSVRRAGTETTLDPSSPVNEDDGFRID